MSQTKRELEHALPFAMEPVVYDFAINERGTCADLLSGEDALLPPGYYALMVPALLRQDPRCAAAVATRRTGQVRRGLPHQAGTARDGADAVSTACCRAAKRRRQRAQSLPALLEQNGFDRAQHEQIRADLKEGRIGLAQNRLPASTRSRTCEPATMSIDAHRRSVRSMHANLGMEALRTAKSPW